jgi:hypothetical protein
MNFTKILDVDIGEVADVGDVRPVMRQHSRRKSVNFGKSRSFPAQRVPGDARRLDAAADAEIPESGHDKDSVMLQSPGSHRQEHQKVRVRRDTG